MQRENEWKSYHTSYEYIKLHLIDSQGRHPFQWLWGRDCNSSRDQIPMLRTNFFTLSNNDGLLEKSLDLIEERRENVMVQLAYYQHKLK